MSLLGRIFADDEELGKKDDDHKAKRANMLPRWSARKTTPSSLGYRRRTVLYALIACIVLYLFFKNIPEPTHPPIIRPTYGRAPRENDSQKGKTSPEIPIEKPPRPEKPSEAEKHYHNGPIRFYKLAASLHAIAGLGGHVPVNRNVLFAASNLRSASELIPVACEMADWDRNDVHIALMGRDDLEMEEIKTLNGVDEQCNVNWHDARPDFSPWSSDFRMEVSVAAGLGHIQTFMHPQVVITDHASREDGFFMKAIRTKTSELGKSLIELPTSASESLMWITRLDSGSLAAWQTTSVDIIIHAPPYSSGSLLRLLKSIEAADYFGQRRPRLTIELPAEIDPPTWAYLEEFTWPPQDESGAPHISQVTLRHRVPRASGSAEEASLRHVESFYPARPSNSHVLVLSPQIELSPLYYHFLMYHLLEYKYSSSSAYSLQSKHLMGLSLELPHMHLNDSTGFSPPKVLRQSKEDDDNDKVPSEAPIPFLWQAPNSNAALYFGDKWIEFHSFLTSRTALDPTKQPGRRKLISELYPAWLEYLQELMRARGYALLYPNFPSSSGHDAIASLHYELYHPPEEFSSKKKSKSTLRADAPVPTLDPKETFSADPSKRRSKHPESTPLTSNLVTLLPSSGAGSVEDLDDLPLLSHEGNQLDYSTFKAFARTFTSDFRRQVGLCAADHKPKVEPMKADDLFCDRNEGSKAESGFGDLQRDDSEAWSGPPIPVEPVVEDGDDVRQSEFEAHLNRQAAGKGGDRREAAGDNKGTEKKTVSTKGTTSPKKDDAKTEDDKADKKAGSKGPQKAKPGEKEDEGEAEDKKEVRRKEKEAEAKDSKEDGKEGKKDQEAEEKPRGW
ncbi:MAG: hypothetical protein Q9219_005223 [cf. Caloplaca sp. 3 TL-2023]